MRRRAGNDFEAPAFLQLTQCPNDISSQGLVEKGVGFAKKFLVKFAELAELGLLAVALDLLARKRDESIEMAQVTRLEEFVLKHRAQGRRERDCKSERNVLGREAPHHAEKREVSFRDRFEKPILLQKILVLRMPDERQMSVKDEREGTGGHHDYIAVIPSEAKDLTGDSHRGQKMPLGMVREVPRCARDDKRELEAPPKAFGRSLGTGRDPF